MRDMGVLRVRYTRTCSTKLLGTRHTTFGKHVVSEFVLYRRSNIGPISALYRHLSAASGIMSAPVSAPVWGNIVYMVGTWSQKELRPIEYNYTSSIPFH